MDNRYSLTQSEIQRLLEHDLSYILKRNTPSPLCVQCAASKDDEKVLCCSRCALLRADHRDAQKRAENPPER